MFFKRGSGEAQHSTDQVAATMRSTSYMGGQQGLYRTKDANKGLDFEPLRSIRKRLGHERIDLLKFDIEGFEWELFKSQILRAGALRPAQISFELHTRGTPAIWVPPSAVRDADKRAVNQLFLDLFDLGYRVVSMDPNGGVPSCAEFVVALGCAPNATANAPKRGACFYESPEKRKQQQQQKVGKLFRSTSRALPHSARPRAGANAPSHPAFTPTPPVPRRPFFAYYGPTWSDFTSLFGLVDLIRSIGR